MGFDGPYMYTNTLEQTQTVTTPAEVAYEKLDRKMVIYLIEHQIVLLRQDMSQPTMSGYTDLLYQLIESLEGLTGTYRLRAL